MVTREDTRCRLRCRNKETACEKDTDDGNWVCSVALVLDRRKDGQLVISASRVVVGLEPCIRAYGTIRRETNESWPLGSLTTIVLLQPVPNVDAMLQKRPSPRNVMSRSTALLIASRDGHHTVSVLFGVSRPRLSEKNGARCVEMKQTVRRPNLSPVPQRCSCRAHDTYRM
jgi:hypothetical protein